MSNIIKSLLVIVAVVAVAGGATYSWFSDTESSEGNTFTAGTLDLELTVGGDATSDPFAFSNVAPGFNKTVTYKVKNAGTMPGKLSLVSANVVNTEGANPESETGDKTGAGELGANMTATVTVVGEGIVVGPVALNDMNYGPLGDTILTPGQEINISIALAVPTTVGNDIQGDIVTGGFEARLDQIQQQ